MGKKSDKQLRKMIRKAIGQDVNVAGAGSTSSGQLSRRTLDELIDQAGGQTGYVDRLGTGRPVLKGFDARVRKAQVAYAAAVGDYERSAARAELENALKSRALAKLVIADNARERGLLPRGRFGPNSADLFGGSTLTLPDDRQVHGI